MIALAPLRDARIVASVPNNKFGLDTALAVGWFDPGFGAITNRTLIDFDVSGIPDDTPAVSLRLHCTGAASGAAQTRHSYVRVLTRAWNEEDVTWNNADDKTTWTTPGGDYTTNGQVAWTLPDTTGEITIEGLREIALAAKAGNGILSVILMRSTESGSNASAVFASREHATEAWRPALLVQLPMRRRGRMNRFDHLTPRGQR